MIFKRHEELFQFVLKLWRKLIWCSIHTCKSVEHASRLVQIVFSLSEGTQHTQSAQNHEGKTEDGYGSSWDVVFWIEKPKRQIGNASFKYDTQIWYEIICNVTPQNCFSLNCFYILNTVMLPARYDSILYAVLGNHCLHVIWIVQSDSNN